MARARERFRRLWGDREGPLSGLNELPATVRGGRLALDGRAVLAVGVVALAGVLVAAWFAWRGSADAQPVARTSVVAPGVALARTSSGSPVPSGSAAPSPVALLVVDVAGRVRRPGLVRVPAGSRVADVLAAAGGTLPGVDLATINLARPVVDGEQILVGIAGAVGGPGAAGSSSGASGPLDLNAATLEQLEALPGVGPVLAQKILDWRTAHGRFTNIDELREVGGIGDKKYGDIAPKVRV